MPTGAVRELRSGPSICRDFAVCDCCCSLYLLTAKGTQSSPHVALRGIVLLSALNGRSKIKPLRRKNTRRKGCGGSANSTYLPSPADAFASLPLRARGLSVVLSPLQARMRRFKTASRGDAGILREHANKRCSPLFACSHVRVFASLPGRKDGIAANDPGPMPEP